MKRCIPSPEEAREVVRLWPHHPRSEIARMTGLSIDAIVSVKQAFGLPSRQGAGGGRPAKIKDPTPEEIAVRSAEVRRRWTAEDHAVRAGLPRLEELTRQPSELPSPDSWEMHEI